MLNNLTQLGGRLTAVVGTTINDAAQTTLQRILAAPERLNPLLEQAIDQLTPIEVVVSCVPNGLDVDNYRLKVDHRDFDAALKTKKLVRPKITIHAVTEDLDRDLLATRLTEELVPLFAGYQSQVDEVRQKKERDDLLRAVSNSVMASLFGAELFLNLLFLCLIGAGALVGPMLWLLLGLGGFAAIIEVPGLFIGSIKQVLFGTEIEQLEREVQNAERVITAMVRQMTITIDPTLEGKH